MTAVSQPFIEPTNGFRMKETKKKRERERERERVLAKFKLTFISERIIHFWKKIFSCENNTNWRIYLSFHEINPILCYLILTKMKRFFFSFLPFNTHYTLTTRYITAFIVQYIYYISRICCVVTNTRLKNKSNTNRIILKFSDSLFFQIFALPRLNENK